MFFKVIALDIDGTLTDSLKRISAATKEHLLRFQQEGGTVILASGRPVQGIRPYAEALELKKYGGYILAYNGGCVVDCRSGEVVFRDRLPAEYVPEICGIIRGYPVGINTYEGDSLVVGQQINRYTRITSRINGMPIHFVEDFAGYVNFDVNKCLLHGEPHVILQPEKILSEKYAGHLNIFKSEPFFLEIVPLGVDKTKSIDRLLRRLGISRDECIACGDGFNDISMIRYAGLGVAMSNAAESVKNAADYVTKSNDDDGIAYLLSRLSSQETEPAVPQGRIG